MSPEQPEFERSARTRCQIPGIARPATPFKQSACRARFHSRDGAGQNVRIVFTCWVVLFALVGAQIR